MILSNSPGNRIRETIDLIAFPANYNDFEFDETIIGRWSQASLNILLLFAEHQHAQTKKGQER